MRYLGSWIGVLAAVLALAGCIKVDQTLTIEPDGSGTLDMTYGLSEQTLGQLEAMEQMAADMKQQGADVESGSPLDFDEAKIRKEFAEKGVEGVELLDVSSETRDGWKYMRVKMAFDDLDSLNETELFEDSGFALAKNAQGNYVLTQKLGSGDTGMPGAQGQGEPGQSPAEDEKMMQAMTAMMAGLRIALTVNAPGEIIESNAMQVEGKRASWVFDIDEDPQVLSKLQGQEEMRVVFAGKGLDLSPVSSDPAADGSP